MYKLTDDDYRKAWGNGISKFTLNARYYKYGWDLEKSINTPLYPIKNKYLQKAKENGVSQSCYYLRVKSGWSKEQACSIPPMWKKKTSNIRKEIKLKQYDTINKCPYDYNLIYDTSICIKNGKCKDCWESIKEVI